MTRAAESAVLEVGGLRIVLAKRQVFRGEERVKLTGMEFSMLELLIGRAGEPIARMDILRRIWGYSLIATPIRAWWTCTSPGCA